MDTVASFTCNDTYNLFGFEASACQADGTWYQSTPLCADIGNEMRKLVLELRFFPIYMIQHQIN